MSVVAGSVRKRYIESSRLLNEPASAPGSDFVWATIVFFFSSRRRHTRWTGDWSSDVCSSDLQDVPCGAPDADARDSRTPANHFSFDADVHDAVRVSYSHRPRR